MPESSVARGWLERNRRVCPAGECPKPSAVRSPFLRLRQLSCCRPWKCAVGQKLNYLLDVDFVVLREAVIAADFLRLESLQNVGIVRSAFVPGDIVVFRAGGGDKGILVSIEQSIEILRDCLPLLRCVSGFENLDGSQKVQFDRVVCGPLSPSKICRVCPDGSRSAETETLLTTASCTSGSSRVDRAFFGSRLMRAKSSGSLSRTSRISVRYSSSLSSSSSSPVIVFLEVQLGKQVVRFDFLAFGQQSCIRAEHFDEGMNLRFGCLPEFDDVVALLGGEEVVGVDGVELGIHAVHAPDALDEAGWIPRDVVIDDRCSSDGGSRLRTGLQCSRGCDSRRAGWKALASKFAITAL